MYIYLDRYTWVPYTLTTISRDLIKFKFRSPTLALTWLSRLSVWSSFECDGRGRRLLSCQWIMPQALSGWFFFSAHPMRSFALLLSSAVKDDCHSLPWTPNNAYNRDRISNVVALPPSHSCLTTIKCTYKMNWACTGRELVLAPNIWGYRTILPRNYKLCFVLSNSVL